MSTTRRTHVVRIPVAGDAGYIASGGAWIDVEVLDAIGLETSDGDEELFEVMQVSDADETTENNNTAGSGGQQRVYDCTAANAVPLIVDNTGDGNGKSPTNPTRSSHMKRLASDPTNPDSGQYLDAEILDGFVLKGPNGSELLLYMPDKAAVPAVVDPTGNDLTVAAGANTTRSLHVEKVIDKVTTIVNGSITSVADDPTKFILVEKTDAIAFKGPNGEEFLVYAPNNADTDTTDNNDTTQYVVDPWTHTSVPPPNTDPNHYIAFPTNTGGPFLGKKSPVSQGLLWWIKAAGETNISSTNNPTISINMNVVVTNLGLGQIIQLYTVLMAGDGSFDVAEHTLGFTLFSGTLITSLSNVTGDIVLYIYLGAPDGSANTNIGASGTTFVANFTATQTDPSGSITSSGNALDWSPLGPNSFNWELVPCPVSLDFITSFGSCGATAAEGTNTNPP